MSPYSDPDKQRQYKRNHYRRKYQRSSNFRIVEAMRKKPWYSENKEAVGTKQRRRGRSQAMKPLAEVFNAPDSYLSDFATLQTWVRWCARGKVPAEKRAGKWYTSAGAIDWFRWSCSNAAHKKKYAAPRKPSWWTAKSGKLIARDYKPKSTINETPRIRQMG
jgi:hypothetical protein